mgnify:CR=1 FL=1
MGFGIDQTQRMCAIQRTRTRSRAYPCVRVRVRESLSVQMGIVLTMRVRYHDLSCVEIGIMVTGLGLFFLVFGTIMFLDRALLAFGNVCTQRTSERTRYRYALIHVRLLR